MNYFIVKKHIKEAYLFSDRSLFNLIIDIDIDIKFKII
jgi:hypothetical protein